MSTESSEELDHSANVSPQITAVLNNDLISLRSLLTSGKSPNVKNNQGNTLLHLAVEGNRREIFDFLLTLDSLRVDVLNFEEESALFMAVRENAVYFTRALIEKGADLNLGADLGVSPLVVAKDVTIAKLLLDKGADANVLDDYGYSVLHDACIESDPELANMLLYYGADPTVPSPLHVLPFAIAASRRCPLWFQEVLFDYIVTEEGVEIHLENILWVMLEWSPLVDKLLDKTSCIIYEEEDLDKFIRYVGALPYDAFKILIEKFPTLANDIFASKKCLLNYIKSAKEENFNWDIFDLCRLNSDYSCIHDKYQQLFFRNFPKERLSEVVVYLLSYGLVISFKMFSAIYTLQGFSPLVEMIVHTEIRRHKNFERLERSCPLMPHFICCPDLNLEERLYQRSFVKIAPGYDELLKYFALPRLKSCVLGPYSPGSSFWKSIEQLPDVPSLLELSRNVARKFLVKRHRIKNNVQFNTMLNALPVASVHKEILSYKKTLYRLTE